MPPKKININNQFGLINAVNTCYINTAVQTLLSFPDLPALIKTRRAQLATNQVHEENRNLIDSLCTLLEYLLQQQYGEVKQNISGGEITSAWTRFLSLFRARKEGHSELGTQQEDSSFALNMFIELLGKQAPLLQKIVKKYGAVSFDGGEYAAKDVPDAQGVLPCIVLPWPTDTKITDLFQDQSVAIKDVTHPDAYDKGMKTPSSCIEITELQIPPGSDSFILLPNHIPVGKYTFAPAECKYDIPGEIELNIQGVVDTFVLASFGQKIGDARSGHYIAYRREGTQWYQINDGSVSAKGEQTLGQPAMPLAIQTALQSTRDSCARQLVYVRKSAFVAQYSIVDPKVKKEEPVAVAKVKKEEPVAVAVAKVKKEEPVAVAKVKKEEPVAVAVAVAKVKKEEPVPKSSLSSLSPPAAQPRPAGRELLSELKVYIFEARASYCDYSNNIWFSFFHRHGATGRRRAIEFYEEFQKIKNYQKAKEYLLDFLGNNKNGNTHPHSFRTMLLHRLLEPTLDELHDVSRNYASRLEQLQERLDKGVRNGVRNGLTRSL